MSSLECHFVAPFIDEAGKVLMQIFFVVTFLSIFFFLFVVKIEKQIFETQVDFVVDNIFDNVSHQIDHFIPIQLQPYFRQKLATYVSQVQPTSQRYESIDATNKNVIDKTETIVITFAVILGAMLIVLFLLRFCTHIRFQAVENLIVLGFIALTEYTFLTTVTDQYIVANPNVVKENFFRTLADLSVSTSST